MLLVPVVTAEKQVVGVLVAENKRGVEPKEGFSSLDAEVVEAWGRVAAADILRLRSLSALRKEASRSERSRMADEVHETMNILATGAMWEASDSRGLPCDPRPAPTRPRPD